MFITSFATADNHWPAIIGYGGLCGLGLGLGYAAPTPAAIKWFPSSMKGMVTGVVVTGMGLAAAYLAPLSNFLIVSYGVNYAFWTLGIGLALAAVCFAQLIRNPPAGYMPPQVSVKAGAARRKARYRPALLCHSPYLYDLANYR